MSVYRRNKTRCQRWYPDQGWWVDCALNEPETRVRKSTEGMIVAPTDDFSTQGPLVIPIDKMIEAIRARSEE